MKKIWSWIIDNALFLLTLFLLVVIPLYPKLPLLDIKNTWVYIRAEDFIVGGVLLIWALFLFTKKVTLKTPLTIPILAFWLIGGISTIHGILIIFPETANVFPNVAFLAYLRHIEYVSLFFIAYAGLKNKKALPTVITVIAATLAGVIIYGAGQRYLGFPAFLTMNEEFAKGIPIQLSNLSRVPSTFAGHYDLAAYLVLVIPILVSVIFAVRNWIVKIVLFFIAVGGFGLMVMTVSRVSFFALIIGIFVVLFFQKKKFVLFSIPLLIICGIIFLTLTPSLLSRFTSTVSEVDVLVDGTTGESVGHLKYVPIEYFNGKEIEQRIVKSKNDLDENIVKVDENDDASPAALLIIDQIPPGTQIPLVMATNVSNGETLPQGTGYINLTLSPVTQRLGNFFYETSEVKNASPAAEVFVFHGNFIVKRAAAYDLSFTTRFQGEWPNAIAAFEKNLLVGSGYGSVSLAIDNNYFRMLGETGILGTASFFAIFILVGMYIKRVWKNIESNLVKSFVVGYIAGVVGLFLNATLIDVFEASKVAFILWTLTGTVLGILYSYEKSSFSVYTSLKKAATSSIAIIIYIFLLTIVIFLPFTSNYFIGDDFTWFKWAASCRDVDCTNIFTRTLSYLTDSQGFFYRPGTKLYFYTMYEMFWLNPVVYHFVSIGLYFICVVLFYILSIKVLKNKLLSSLITFLFIVMSGYVEMVAWISATGHLVAAVFVLLSILLYNLWLERKQILFYILTIICICFGLLFHEFSMVIPLLLISYTYFINGQKLSKIVKSWYTVILFVPNILYLIIRFYASSHWFNGDYSYNILKLPFNVIGNSIGYTLLTFLGPIALPVNQILRDVTKTHIVFAAISAVLFITGCFFIIKYLRNKFDPTEKRIILFGFSFFVISLLPFLGLGNITERYSFLASFGLLFIFAIVIKHIYEVVKSYGNDIVGMIFGVGIIVFALFHIIQAQQMQGDWRGAGGMVKNFFVSIDSAYVNEWSDSKVSLHFINVPIRYGDAWVFPVGLEDALFLAFRNEDLQVYKHATRKEALDSLSDATYNKIFEFRPDGSLKNVPIPRKLPVEN